MDLAAKIRDVPDFPEPGILFKDIAPLLKDPAAMKHAAERLAEPYKSDPPAAVLGVEARGFLFAPTVAAELGCGVVPVRKPGKLPGEVAGLDYELEYGTDRLEIQADAVAPGTRVLVLDDVLATGGTVAAAIQLAKQVGAEVIGAAFLIELAFLNGRDQLGDVPVHAVLTY